MRFASGSEIRWCARCTVEQGLRPSNLSESLRNQWQIFDAGDHQEFVTALGTGLDVDGISAGDPTSGRGVAAVIRGAPIATIDLDILARVGHPNAERLLQALVVPEARHRERRAVVKPAKEDILAGGHLLLMTRAGPHVIGGVGPDRLGLR